MSEGISPGCFAHRLWPALRAGKQGVGWPLSSRQWLARIGRSGSHTALKRRLNAPGGSGGGSTSPKVVRTPSPASHPNNPSVAAAACSAAGKRTLNLIARPLPTLERRWLRAHGRKTHPLVAKGPLRLAYPVRALDSDGAPVWGR